MNDLMIFKNPEFGEIRTVELAGEPWLVGKDVAEALGYSNPRDALDRHVDNEDLLCEAAGDPMTALFLCSSQDTRKKDKRRSGAVNG